MMTFLLPKKPQKWLFGENDDRKEMNEKERKGKNAAQNSFSDD